MIIKKILSFVASIIKLFIVLNFIIILNAFADNNKYYSDDKGVLSIMYHRFNEKKYPSTNINMEIFKKQIEIIKNNNINFNNPDNFNNNFDLKKSKKEILITIDDAFTSFYENAWPFLKREKIPFILFVSTQPVGKSGYMNWSQIKEVEKEEFAFIGNHSHSHEYLIEYNFEEFKKDIDTSIKIFNEKIGYNPIFFSYPFGEFSEKQLSFIKKKFKYGFGQHSGVIDINKDPFELPRFPINEKYGDLERFEFIIDLLPLEYKNVIPKDKYITNNNPPKLEITFFEDQKNLENINCFSDEGNNWKQSKIKFQDNKLFVDFSDKFLFRRGRINCSLNDKEGWRWFGLQFSVRLN